jgi:hypothetical protein
MLAMRLCFISGQRALLRPAEQLLGVEGPSRRIASNIFRPVQRGSIDFTITDISIDHRRTWSL